MKLILATRFTHAWVCFRPILILPWNALLGGPHNGVTGLLVRIFFFFEIEFKQEKHTEKAEESE